MIKFFPWYGKSIMFNVLIKFVPNNQEKCTNTHVLRIYSEPTNLDDQLGQRGKIKNVSITNLN